MNSLADQDFSNGLRQYQKGKYAFMGDVAVQAHLYNFCNRNLRQMEALARPVSNIEVLTMSAPPLGIFDSHRDAMLEDRNIIEGPYCKLAVIPAEYLIAMLLANHSTQDIWDISTLLQAGKNRIDCEEVRSILKSVSRPERFEIFKKMLYDFST